MKYILSFIIALAFTMQISAQGTMLLREPAISQNHIVFVYANDLWLNTIGEPDAIRLTTAAGAERNPHFSPDGKWIAFTGQYDGNTDVYVIPVTGGQPRRLTWHPGADQVIGWMPGGDEILFSSGRMRQPLKTKKNLQNQY